MDRPAGRRLKALLLQGPVGGFFDRLGRGFEEHGWCVRKIDFNGGDVVFSRGNGIRYIGPFRSFPDWFESFCKMEEPDAIVLFGDRRPVHMSAITVARRLDVPVWCFEEGYLRPDYVTLEIGGNNALSPLAAWEETCSDLPEVDLAGVRGRPAFRAMAMRAVLYYAAMRLGRRGFSDYRHHRNRPFLEELTCWARSLSRKIAGVSLRHATQTCLNRTGFPTFIFAAQVHDDLQVVCHGRGWTVPDAIAVVIRSFARHAPSQAHLMIKVHPLARGHFDHHRLASDVSRTYGCMERVSVIDSGSMDVLVRNCAGVVTINSTSGLAALQRGRPVMVLGDTFYTRPGLARALSRLSDLDAFWHEPVAPDPRRWKAFREAMIRGSLVPGSFYLPDTWPSLVKACVRRIEERIPATTLLWVESSSYSVAAQATFAGPASAVTAGPTGKTRNPP